MKNRVFGYMVVGLMGLALMGCSPQTENTASVESTPVQETVVAKEQTTTPVVEEPVIQGDQAQTMRVGEANYGFSDVPANWVNFKDQDVTLNIVQFSDPAGKSILTFNAWKDPENNAQAAASSVWTSLESEGVIGVEGAKVKLGSHNAFQVYGLYGAEKIMFISWFFDTDDGYIHFISLEGPQDEMRALVDLLEGSFDLKK